jgi:hypothetical protein
MPDLETCDEGATQNLPCPYPMSNITMPNTCTNRCNATCNGLLTRTGPYCGDGLVTNSETCDQGAANGTPCAYGDMTCTRCNPTCSGLMTTMTVPPLVTARCGDNAIQASFGEDCDGTASFTKPCSDYGHTSGTVTCNSSSHATAPCKFNSSGCSTPPTCGDGEINGTGEQCDGTNLAGQTCQSFMYMSGTLGCEPPADADRCEFDFSNCVPFPPPPTCGDGIKNQGETAIDCGDDGVGDFNGCQRCADNLACQNDDDCISNNCVPDGGGPTKHCEAPPAAVCGNGVRQGAEQCDYGGAMPPATGANNNGTACGPTGTGPAYETTCLGCTATCTFIVSSGGFCGDGVKNGPEMCDELDLGGAMCPAGTMGTPVCTPGCMLNVAPPNCVLITP